MRNHTASLTVAALAATVLTAAAAPATAGTHHRQTDYGFSGHTYGSVAHAEQAGVGSGRTAPTWLGCTRLSGLKRHNVVASAGDAEGSSLRVTGVDNSQNTFRNRRQLGSRAFSTVDEAVLGDPAGPHLTIRNLRTRSKAFAKRGNGKLRAVGSVRGGSVVADTGTPLDLLLEQAGSGFDDLLAQIEGAGGSLPVPGFGELQTGERTLKQRRHKAVAQTSALRARLYGANGVPGGDDDVRVVLARSRAAIHDNLVAGVFRGRAVPLQSRVAGDLLAVGRVHAKPLPCQGTGGQVRGSSLASVDLGNAGAIDVAGLRTRVYGVQKQNRSARGWTESRVQDLTLGGGEVSVTGIVGRANVKTNRRGKVIRKGFRGTRVGELVVGGETQEPPSPGDVVEVPGVGTLEFFVRDRMKRGAAVTALRVTLAPGTPGESVIDLGQARTVIRRN